MKIAYRPEIDGLRAIAVVAVILYHAQVSTFFVGGFIGVDIFFVISGYLITSIILKELVTKKYFSFKFFYERRIRRILPALLTMKVIVFFLGWIFLPPSRFVEFSKSIFYSLGFSSNFYFHYTGLEYEAFEGLFVPLLHTWSLSVEEQYYIIFPICLLITFKFFRKYILYVLILGLLLSFLFAEWGSRNTPSNAFYFIHTRMWELLAGSLLSYLEINLGRRSQNKILNLILPTFGLFLIIISILLFSHSVRHPSFFTIFPIAGTCLIIWFSNKNDLTTKLLSTKLFVGVGLISYSLYIWHFPIFSFAKISGLVSGSILLKVLLALVTFAISVLSFFIIEKRFRYKEFSYSNVLKYLFFLFFIIILSNFLVINNKGFENRFENLKLINKNYNINNFYLERNRLSKEYHEKKFFTDGKINILIIGDSHADDFHNMFFNNTKFFPKYDFIATLEYKLNDIKNNPLLKEADIIVFSFRWDVGDSHVDLVFNELVPFLKKLNKKIVITSSVNEYFAPSVMYTLIDHEILFGDKKIDYFGLKNLYFQKRTLTSESEINIELKKLSSKHNLQYLNKEDYMCNLIKQECDYVTPKGFKLFYDNDHMTSEGAKYFGKKIHKLNWFQVD